MSYSAPAKSLQKKRANSLVEQIHRFALDDKNSVQRYQTVFLESAEGIPIRELRF